jgi:hypothetical protein
MCCSKLWLMLQACSDSSCPQVPTAVVASQLSCCCGSACTRSSNMPFSLLMTTLLTRCGLLLLLLCLSSCSVYAVSITAACAAC